MSEDQPNKICQDAILWPAESVFIGWLSASLLATTAALLFYHMADSGTLPVRVFRDRRANKMIAGFVSSGMILSAVIYATAGIIPYNMRVSDCYYSEPENAFRWIDTFMGAFTILIEIVIAMLIIKDSYEPNGDKNKDLVIEALADIVRQRLIPEGGEGIK